jgi:hypothetical protein
MMAATSTTSAAFPVAGSSPDTFGVGVVAGVGVDVAPGDDEGVDGVAEFVSGHAAHDWFVSGIGTKFTVDGVPDTDEGGAAVVGTGGTEDVDEDVVGEVDVVEGDGGSSGGGQTGCVCQSSPVQAATWPVAAARGTSASTAHTARRRITTHP